MMSDKIVEERMAIGRGRHVNHTQYPLGARIFNTESFHIVQKNAVTHFMWEDYVLIS